MRTLWKDETAVTSVEYALLLAIVVVAGLAVWSQLGQTVRNVVQNATAAIENATQP